MIKNYLRKIYISNIISPLINLLGFPWKGKGAILVYHRVVKDEQIEEDLELGLTVSCSNFERHIRELKSKYKICSMNELLSYILWEQLWLGCDWGLVRVFLGGFYFEKL